MATKKSIPIVFLFLLLTGCGGDTVFHQYLPVPSQGWHRQDTLTFVLPDTFTRQACHMEIELRHTATYPYRNIGIGLLHPLNTVSTPDTFRLELADFRGEWKGKGTPGGLFQFKSLPINLVLAPSDTLIQLVHIMRDPCLEGITDVGICLSFTGSIDTQKNK